MKHNIQSNPTLDIMVNSPGTQLSPEQAVHSIVREEHPAAARSQGAGPRDYWIAWKRSFKYAVLLGLLGALALLAFGLMINATYTSEATIKIETDHTRILEYDVDTSRQPSFSNDDFFYNTQYKLLRSRDLARSVIDDMAIEGLLLEQKTFSNPISGLRNWVKEQKEWIIALLPLPKQSDDTASDAITAEEVFFSNLTISPIRQSRVIDLQYTDQSPERSQETLEAYIKHFINLNHLQRIQSSEQAKDYLSDQIAESRTKLESAEEKLLAYARKNKIVDTNTDVSVIAKNLSLLNEAYIKAKSKRIDAESQYQNKRNISSQVNANTNALIQAKKQELSSLQAEYRSKLSLFKPAYPEMQKLKQQIDQLSQFINRESQTISNHTNQNMEADFAASREEEAKLRNEIKRLEGDLLKFYENSIGYGNLKRDVDTSRKLYEGLLQRFKEINVIGPAPGDNISVVDSAHLPPRKNGVSTTKYALLGSLLGLLLYTLVTLIREWLQPKIRTEQALNNISGYPVLTSIPQLRTGWFGGNRLALRGVHHVKTAESLRYLRTSLQLTNDNMAIPPILQITSPNPGDGKSTIAVFLATSLAYTGKKVLLIDADLRKPSIHKKISLKHTPGLTNFIYGDRIKIHKHFIQSSHKFFLTITAGPAVLDPVNALQSARFTQLLQQSKNTFDHIIIDSPPVLGLSDSLVTSRFADNTLLVVSNNTTSQRDITQSIKRLEQGNAKIAGLICNKSDESFSKTYYNTSYSDHRDMIIA